MLNCRVPVSRDLVVSRNFNRNVKGTASFNGPSITASFALGGSDGLSDVEPFLSRVTPGMKQPHP